MIFARKINKIPEFYMIFARKVPKFYTVIAQKILFRNFLGARAPQSPSPLPSHTPMELRLTNAEQHTGDYIHWEEANGLSHRSAYRPRVNHHHLHRVPKNQAPKHLAVTLSNLNRFFKFFHCQTQQEICYAALCRHCIIPNVCRYTTL